MAQRPSVVTAEVTSVPDPTEISRVATFVREPFVEEGEDAAAVLAPGSIRRHAFEFARAELDAGAAVPSQKWRRRWSLLLGLDRTLNTATPVLADGTTLNPHQIDALSGTYAALLADAQRRATGGSGSDGDALLLSFEDEDPTEIEEPPAQIPADEDDDHDDEGPSEDDDPDGDGAASDDEDDDELEAFDPELEELPEAEPESEFALYDDVADEDVDEDIDRVALEDPNAHKRFWFEHATGAGKTVAAMGFVEACRTGGILILTHRRNLVDQFQDELRTRGYGERLHKPLLTDADGNDPNPDVIGPVTIETYQWFVRNAGRISGAYTVVICDEAHTALGDKTSGAIRAWTGPIFIGMTATGALIARHVADLFPTQTSRFDLAQAARRGVIAPLRCLRIPPGPGVRTIAKVPLRKGEVDMEFDQDELAKLLDQAPFNLAIADLYKTRFRNTPGVVYTAGVKHAYNVAESFRALGMKAMAVSGETPKRELATILAQYDAGEIDVLINAQLLAEGWNSPRATICMHLAPTASKRIYQQRVGRVTRRHPGKEAGVVIDFVHPATANDDPVVTLHSLLDRDVYRGGAIVVGPVRRGRGRRVKVERRVLPVTPDIERRRQVFERELWRIAVEQLDWGEQRVWAALAGAKASPANWRRGRAMLNFDRSGELRRQFLITALERNRSQPLRMRAIQEISLLREAEPFDTAIDFIGQWPRDERREAARTLLQAMADRRIGRRDQATAWIWRLAEYTRDVHEEYAAQRWPATKHLLGLLVNSSGAAHARNARRLVHGARQHDRRLQAALLAAAVAHSPEAEEVLREARTRLARKPGALSRDLLKDFPNGKRRKKRSRKRRGGQGAANGENTAVTANGENGDEVAVGEGNDGQTQNGVGNGNGQNGNGGNGQGNGQGNGRSRRGRSRGGRRRNRGGGSNAEATTETSVEPTESGTADAAGERPAEAGADSPATDEAPTTTPARRRRVRGQKAAEAAAAAEGSESETGSAAAAAASGETSAKGGASVAESEADAKPAPRRTRTRKTAAEKAAEAAASEAPTAGAADEADKPARRTRTRKTAAEKAAEAEATPSAVPADSDATPAKTPARRTRTRKTAAEKAASETEATPVKKPAARKTAPRKTAAQKAAEAAATGEAAPAKPVRKAAPRKTAAQKAAEAAASGEAAPAKPARKAAPRKTAAQKAAEAEGAAATPAKKPAVRKAAPRKTAAQKAAEAAAAGETDAAPVKKPAARKPAARKTAAATSATKTAAKKPATRRKATPKAEAE